MQQPVDERILIIIKARIIIMEPLGIRCLPVSLFQIIIAVRKLWLLLTI
jgi:hypothetical protein